MTKLKYFFIPLLFLLACGKDDNSGGPQPGLLQLQSARVGTYDLSTTTTLENAPVDKGIVISFSLPLERTVAESAITVIDANRNPVELSFAYLDDDKTIAATSASGDLIHNSTYTVFIDQVVSTTGEVFPGTSYIFSTEPGELHIEFISVEGQNLNTSDRVRDIPLSFQIEIKFNEPLVSGTAFDDLIRIRSKNGYLDLSFDLSDDNKKLTLDPSTTADYVTKYNFSISEDLESEEGFIFEGFDKEFYTAVDETYKFPEISDEELLTKVQQQTFRYFWDFGHPVSGLARERNTSGNTVTIGGSGFGVMAIPVGIERGFITRQQGVDRLETIVNFLKDADRFHGAWPHWMNGNTGTVIPFSTKDNGGDLVETAFMIEGLLTVRQYLNPDVPQEKNIIDTITELWETVEWDWYTQGGQKVLYWHWSPNYGWDLNHQIKGWNEALIIYVLAASSPTHAIEADVYNQGWASNGGMKNGNDYYGITLPLGPDRGGPLFFAHYSFLGLDPQNLEDQYANYWTQNVNHTLINRAYCIQNPLNYVGYGEGSWGLTASDNYEGYSAHSPTNDKGVITPTAALSSMPYTPQESLEAMKFFYYILGDKLWGEYGFYDAFSLTNDWVANSYLAIDQGPIIIMIENYRTQLLWDHFMSNPEITSGLDKLGFTSY